MALNADDGCSVVKRGAKGALNCKMATEAESAAAVTSGSCDRSAEGGGGGGQGEGLVLMRASPVAEVREELTMT
jgi:hypothetical protein